MRLQYNYTIRYRDLPNTIYNETTIQLHNKIYIVRPNTIYDEIEWDYNTTTQ